jgi:hypothetical protein
VFGVAQPYHTRQLLGGERRDVCEVDVRLVARSLTLHVPIYYRLLPLRQGFVENIFRVHSY